MSSGLPGIIEFLCVLVIPFFKKYIYAFQRKNCLDNIVNSTLS